jgi:hypothetical protein
MSRGRESAGQSSVVARDRVIDTVRTQLRIAIQVERRFTVEQISEQSGVAVRALRSYMANDPTEAREPSTSALLSIGCVLGPRCVNAVLSLIGYGGAEPLDEPDQPEPMTLAGDMMTELAIITQAAARGKGRINHQDAPAVEKAANQIVHDALKLSSIAEAE